MKVSGCSSTIRWYNTNAESYANKLATYVPQELIDQFLEMLPVGKVEITDVGCAAGRDSNIFSKERQIRRVSGVDLSYGLVKIARTRFPHIDFIKANFLNLPHEDSSLHGVWAYAAVVHLDTKEDAIRSTTEFNRVLQRGGILLISVKEKSGEDETEIVKDKFSKGFRFFRYYTLDELQEYIEVNGFEIVEVNYNRDNHGRGTNWINVFSKKVRVPSERTINAIIQRVSKLPSRTI